MATSVFPKPASPQISLDDFCAAHHLLVSYSGNPFGFADRALAEMGRSRRVVITVNQFFTAGQVVINSDLLAVLPAHFLPATGFADRLVVRRPPIDLGIAEVDAVWLRPTKTDMAHQWLIRQLVRAAREAFADSPDAQPVGR